MKFRREVIPFLLAALVAGAILTAAAWLLDAPDLCALQLGAAFAALACGYFLYFFRDPPRQAPGDADAVVAGAEGRVAAITDLTAEAFRRTCLASGLRAETLGDFPDADAVRISIYLTPFDVHVNRAPISGESRFLGYFPGKHYLTIREKSSEYNQHNTILMVNDRTRCLIHQIVGPICRRVVYWHDPERPVRLTQGDPIGMMKFGSRLDMILPRAGTRVVVRAGDKVRAGETIVARLEPGAGP